MSSQSDSQPVAGQGNSASNAARDSSAAAVAQEALSSHPTQSGSAPVEAQDTLPLPKAEVAGPKVPDPVDTPGSQTIQSQPLDEAESQHLRFKVPLAEQRRLTDTFEKIPAHRNKDEEPTSILKEPEAPANRNTDEQTSSTSRNPDGTAADFRGIDEEIASVRRNLDGLAEDDPSRRSIDEELSRVLTNHNRPAMDDPLDGSIPLDWAPQSREDQVAAIVRDLDRRTREARRAREQQDRATGRERARRRDICGWLPQCFCFRHYFKWVMCLFC